MTVEQSAKAPIKHTYNTAAQLIEMALDRKEGCLTDTGALSVATGHRTGRSPADRYIVREPSSEEAIEWGSVNREFDAAAFDALWDRVKAHLATGEQWVQHLHVGEHHDHYIPVRVMTGTAWQSLFGRNMFIRPENYNPSEKPEWQIMNVADFICDPEQDGTNSDGTVIINFGQRKVLIAGMRYAGEMKKAMFSVQNFLLPEKDVLPMHCSANIGDEGDTTLFFGLSGTGKTTLSADAKRRLIGDDEHGWTPDNKVFNFEGGCYAKVIDLSRQKEPDIFDAIKKGGLLENVIIDQDRHVDYSDTTLTQNTRVSYPLHHIRNTATPSIGEQTKHIFFLTADAFGVLPPITMLNPYQAAYHFISGYTAKIGGTEEGIQKPQPSFSACFGAPFMPLHPGTYASLLAKKIEENEISVWLINTGWTGGPYGVGHRILLQHTRAMIEAARTGLLNPNYKYTDYHIHSVFGIAQPRTCPGVPDTILSPRQTWNDDKAFYKQAHKLARAFHNNFKQFEDNVSKEILNGAPNFR